METCQDATDAVHIRVFQPKTLKKIVAKETGSHSSHPSGLRVDVFTADVENDSLRFFFDCSLCPASHS